MVLNPRATAFTPSGTVPSAVDVPRSPPKPYDEQACTESVEPTVSECTATDVGPSVPPGAQAATQGFPPVTTTIPPVTTTIPLPSRMSPESFDLLRVVGKGAFGKVFQVRERVSRRIYAMKVMHKDRILQRGHEEYVRMEQDVLTSVRHPYIITLRYAFQTPSKLYLVLDFISGGHLFYKLYNEGLFDEGETRLMAAQLVSALTHLHSLGIAHRDLKPENVLLDEEGHAKLTDFGLSKNLGTDTRTNSFIGTMEYMAPEIIKGTGHSKEVDWWSLGVLIYEMLVGRPPFESRTRAALQTQIVSGKIKLQKYFSTSSVSIIKGLLCRDPLKRLGYGPNGGRDVKAHPFFKGINWAALDAREIPSPFRPPITPMADCTANFDRLWTDMPPIDSPTGSPTGDGVHFERFSFRPTSEAEAELSGTPDEADAAAPAPA